MANLATNFVGIKSPNPFWLASAPPTDKEYNVVRAFEQGWGGAVWKTVGEDPPIVNVNGPRYAALLSQDRRVIGFNNIELISDRPLKQNLDEMRRVKRDWPDRAVVASLMVPCTEDAWRNILKMVEDTGCDGIELNFGCPHGMSERGMGSAVGQVPEYIEMVARWCKHYSKLPVIVKLTPNITDIRSVFASLNIAYHLAHRKEGEVMFDVTTGKKLTLSGSRVFAAKERVSASSPPRTSCCASSMLINSTASTSSVPARGLTASAARLIAISSSSARPAGRRT